MIREDGFLQDNLLEQLNQLVGQVGGHGCLHRHGDVLGVLGLRQGRLYHLGQGQRQGEIKFSPSRKYNFPRRQILPNVASLYLVDERPPVLIILAKHLGPELHIPPLDQVAGLGLEAGLLAEGGDVRAVVARKHLVTHDRVSHLGRGHEKRKRNKEKKINKEKDEKQEMKDTCGAAMRFIFSSLVCSGPSAGRLFFRPSSRKAVHCCTCSVQCAVCSVQCAVCSVQCTRRLLPS